MRFRFSYLILVLTVSACSGSRGTSIEDPVDRPPSINEVLEKLPEYETFDEASYPLAPPVEDITVEHDVPEALLAGNVGGNTSDSRSGWRIQVAFAREKTAADDAVDEVVSWLAKMRRTKPEIEAFQQSLPVYNEYLQPYFRIRIGDFRSKEAAEELLMHIIPDYPGAFVMVDQIN